MRTCVAVAMGVVMPTATALSQTRVTKDRTAKRCESVLASVSRGNAALSSDRAAWAELPRCARHIDARVAAGVMSLRSTRDTTALLATMPALWPVGDGEAWRASVRLAEDGGATSASRVFALRTLLAAVSKNTASVPFQQLFGAGKRCALAQSTGMPYVTGANPLPADPRGELRRLTAQLSVAAQPAEVRSAAECIGWWLKFL